MTDEELVAFLRARWAEERRVAVEASHQGWEVPPLDRQRVAEHWCWHYEDTAEPVPLEKEAGQLDHFCLDGGHGAGERRRARLHSLNWYAKRREPGCLRHMVVQDALVDVGAAVHIARHAPARVLADIAAKEQILLRYELLRQRWEQGEATDDATVGAIDSLEKVLRTLADAYAGPMPLAEEYADEPPF
jgi:hypothetical protein